MQKVRVTKCFTFDMAHALAGYDGLCRNIHGHTYSLSITLLGDVKKEHAHPKDGFVLDFGILKQIVKQEVLEVFDHSLILQAEFIKEEDRKVLEGISVRIHYVDFQPTCENILLDIKNRINCKFPKEVTLVALRLDETPTSYAEWFLADQD